ncbi:MAG: hypothetical protein AAFW83_04270 [Pseudomonadota bacterium]
MIKNLVLVCGALIVLGLLGGVLSALAAGGAYAKREQAWQTAPAPNDFAQLAKADQARLLKTGHFGFDVSTIRQATVEETTPQAPSFPLIVAVQTIDEQPFVTVLGQDRATATYPEGATLDGGWTIEAITLDTVTVRNGDSTTQITVFPTKN